MYLFIYHVVGIYTKGHVVASGDGISYFDLYTYGTIICYVTNVMLTLQTWLNVSLIDKKVKFFEWLWVNKGTWPAKS